MTGQELAKLSRFENCRKLRSKMREKKQTEQNAESRSTKICRLSAVCTRRNVFSICRRASTVTSNKFFNIASCHSLHCMCVHGIYVEQPELERERKSRGNGKKEYPYIIGYWAGFDFSVWDLDWAVSHIEIYIFGAKLYYDFDQAPLKIVYSFQHTPSPSSHS